MDPQPSAPPVVAVVVASEQGDWFEETLASLGAQDYPNQSVLVVGGGDSVDPASRVAAVLPDAYLRRPANRGGFAALANDALETVRGSAFLVFCHDDVAPAPDAVRLMVEEALRSNAGIVGPKLVDWDDETRLLDVGLAVDKTGAAASLVDRGELDQEQHDGVRDVFAVPDACMLVRSDLFLALGGLDPALGDHGVDVDLCWRAQVVGARVMVAPAARVRHREGGREAPGVDTERHRMEARNHLRTMLKSYSLLHLVRVVPQAAVVSVVETVIALFTRRWSQARELAGAWLWNLRHLKALRADRRAVQKSRTVPDSDVRRLQVRASVRMSAFLRRQLHAEDRAQAILDAGQRLVGRVGRGPAQAAAGLLTLLCVALLVGSRGLLFGKMPAVGQLIPLPGPTTLLSHFFHGWRTTGMGSQASTPPAFALLGAGGLVVLGHMAVLQKLLVLGAWPVAAIGAWRLGRPFRSGLGHLVLVITYLSVPLSYGAVNRGHWDGLIAYAAAPWMLRRVARLAGLAPFAGPGAQSLDRRRLEVAGFAVGLALVGALAPGVGLAALVIAVGVLVGSVVAGEAGEAARGLAATAVAVLAAAVLLLPWGLDLLIPGRGAWMILGTPRSAAHAYGLGALLRFQVGELGSSPVGWALVVAALLPLILAHGERLAWAVRMWAVAIVSVGLAWAAGRGWLLMHAQAPDVLLAPAALALCIAAALGAAAFEIDLPRFRFGWRQVASVVAGAAVTLGTLPVAIGAVDGQWHLPKTELTRSLTWMAPTASDGAFRVLWMGDPEVLPLGSWPMGNGLAYATSRNGTPVATDLLPGPRSSATGFIADAVEQASRGDTARLGRLLAPMAIRYVVLPAQLAAGAPTKHRVPPPARLTRGLQSQLDLRLLPSDPAAVIYENTAWGPGREVASAGITESGLPTGLGTGADLRGGQPVLPGRGPVRFAGRVPSGPVLVSESPSSRWVLTVGGNDADRQTAFGVANAYRITGTGSATLHYRTPITRYLALLVELALWVVVLRGIRQLRRRLRGSDAETAGAGPIPDPVRDSGGFDPGHFDPGHFGPGGFDPEGLDAGGFDSGPGGFDR